MWTMANIQPIIDDWDNKKCDPSVIPFAGIIMNPSDQSKMEYTANNFNDCVQGITVKLTSLFLEPIHMALSSVQNVMADIGEAINYIRIVIDKIRSSMSDITQEIFGRTLGIMIPLQVILISVKDLLGKVQGMMVTGMYTGLAVYDTILTAISASWELMVILMVVMTGAIGILLSLFVSIPAGLVALALYIPLAIIMTEFLILCKNTLHISGMTKLPKIPSCFDSKTKISTTNGIIYIEDLKQGSILLDGTRVTAVLKLSSNNQYMYNLNNIIVSGSHKIWYHDHFISVCNHPDAIYVHTYNNPYIYCYNTMTKLICIDNHIFTDWDEIDQYELDNIMNMLRKRNIPNPSVYDVHINIEGGFIKDSLVHLQRGYVPIQDVHIHDILHDCGQVVGVVRIDARDLITHQYNNSLTGSNLGINILNSPTNIIKCDTLYHLVTTEPNIIVDNTKCPDYDKRIANLLKL
jgi:hypothetical protein